jgi:hypothetical protein
MKHLHDVFDDDEYAKLLKAKGSKTWHDFILEKCLGE